MITLDIPSTNGATFLTNLKTVNQAGLFGIYQGLKISNGTDTVNDIDVALGRALSDSGNFIIDGITSTHVKQIDVVFAEYSVIGTPSGGRDTADNLTGAKWFRVYLIGGTGKNDQMFFSTSASPTLPSGFTEKVRIAWVNWNGSALLQFVQVDATRFMWNVPFADINDTDPGAARILATLTAPPDSVAIILTMIKSAATTSDYQLILSTVSMTDAAPSLTAVPLATDTIDALNQERSKGPLEIFVDSSSQVAYRGSASAADIIYLIETFGYIDRKERP